MPPTWVVFDLNGPENIAREIWRRLAPELSSGSRRLHAVRVYETPDLGCVGLLICYEMVFPEAPRCLALGGADIIFHLTLGGAAIGDGDISRAAFRTRAVENFIYLVVSQRGSGSGRGGKPS